jgi:cytochrome d ubiquinol oxidase subunit I
MDLDPVLLSRLQFAWVIGWHILIPAFTVGMASYIAILEGMHLVTGRAVYLRISMYWIRISLTLNFIGSSTFLGGI